MALDQDAARQVHARNWRDLQIQTHALGWEIDDVLVTGSDASTGDGVRLAISCKSNVRVTASGPDFVSAAWKQGQKSEPMKRGTDRLAVATRGRNTVFDETWSDIKAWCADVDIASTTPRLARWQNTIKFSQA
jgi:hypothetical protein